MMDIFDIIKKYDRDNLYNIRTVIKEIPSYFGLSIEEMLDIFQKYFIISKESIYNYLSCEYKENSSIILKDREYDYYYYSKTLEILSNKVLNLLDLLNYLAVSTGNTNINIYEKKLKELQIYHYSDIVKGEDIERILVVLFHIIKMFDQTLNEINDVCKYKDKRINTLLLDVYDDKNYPSKTLVTDFFKSDKTSFKTKRKKYKYNF